MMLELKNALFAAAAFFERLQSSGQPSFDCHFYFQKIQFKLSFALCSLTFNSVDEWFNQIAWIGIAEKNWHGH